MQTLAAARAGGDEKILKKIWLSLLLPVGVLAGSLVIASTKYGILKYRCKLEKLPGATVLLVDTTPPNFISYDYVHDPTQWKLYEVDLELPGERLDRTQFGDRQPPLLVLKESREDLLPYAFRRGLLELTTTNLGKLYTELRIKSSSRKPTTEQGLMNALGKHIIGESFDGQQLKAVMEARAAPFDELEELVLSSPLKEGEVEDVLNEDIEDMQLEEEIRKAKAKWNEQKKKSRDEGSRGSNFCNAWQRIRIRCASAHQTFTSS